MVEFLVAMMAMGFMLMILSSISVALINFPAITFVSQFDLFALQIDQLFSRGRNFRLEDKSLCFDLDFRSFCVEYVDNRLVKTPGYEILLENISEIRWEFNENEISLYGIYQKSKIMLNFEVR